MKKATRLLLAAALLTGLAWSTATAALWWWQEGLLFHPEPLPADTVLSTAPDVQERSVDDIHTFDSYRHSFTDALAALSH